MKKAILATKVGMTQIFNEDGVLTPVTVLQAGPCAVTQVKTVENDGYSAVQVGFGDIREKLVNKPQKGHFAKAGVENKRFLKEFKFDNAEEYQVGQEIKDLRRCDSIQNRCVDPFDIDGIQRRIVRQLPAHQRQEAKEHAQIQMVFLDGTSGLALDRFMIRQKIP